MPEELMTRLSAAGWCYISTRTTGNGLVLHKLGRGRLTSALWRGYAEEEERSVEGWRYEAEQGG